MRIETIIETLITRSNQAEADSKRSTGEAIKAFYEGEAQAYNEAVAMLQQYIEKAKV